MNRPFKIVMMNKQEIRIDAEEIPKILKGISTNSPVILKQGIFNPSMYSHIIEDTNRGTKERLVDDLGHYTKKYEMKYEEIPDIFAEIKELAEMKRLQ